MGVVIPIAAVVLLAVTTRAARGVSWLEWRADRVDRLVGGGLYAAVVGCSAWRFVGFTAARVLGLFLAFAGGLVLGVAGPVVYTTWVAPPFPADPRARCRYACTQVTLGDHPDVTVTWLEATGLLLALLGSGFLVS